jgi:hypothetical protein
MNQVSKEKVKVMVSISAMVAIGYLLSGIALGQTSVADVIIGQGDDKTAELSIINNILNTGQKLILYGFGPLLGSVMWIKGFNMVGKAERGEKMPGIVMIVCGACCFALGPLIEQTLKIMS